MIDQDLKAFLEGPVMMVLGTRGASGAPAISRGLGARLDAEGQVEVVVSRDQWPDAVGHLTAGDPIALTVCRPSDYETFQIKGLVTAFGPADADARAWSQRYMLGISSLLEGLGVTRMQIAAWLSPRDQVSIRMRPNAVFSQTPGPGAGRRLQGIEA